MSTVTWLGHATVLIEMDGVRVLTDPLLRSRFAHVIRRVPLPDVWRAPIDAVVISHLHWDHFDLPSLRRLGTEVRLIVPRGAASMLHRAGFERVEEVAPGESIEAGALRIEATPANHSGFRPPRGPAAQAVGYIIEGTRRVYFAGDTGLFPEMAALGGIDLALLPVGGWGPWLRGGHMDPEEAAEALWRIAPSAAIPIHWGTYWPFGLPRGTRFALPGVQFAEYAARYAPGVVVRVPRPGQRVEFGETVDAAPTTGSLGS